MHTSELTVVYVGVGEQTGESGGEEEFDKRQSEEGESGLDWQVSRENCGV